MKQVLDIVSGIVNWCVKALGIVSIPILILFGIHFAYLYIFKKMRFKGKRTTLKKESFFKRLFIRFPNQFWIDNFNRDPDEFRDFGVHLIAGEQGAGKTITLAYLLRRYQKQYKLCKVRTNFNYQYQDGEIKHWKDLVKNDNGIFGQIEVLDEIQNWFNSLQSKDFPMEMMTEITQQRKQRKVIFATSQVFSRVAKPIREQTTFLYEPTTIFGCLTIVKKTRPKLDENGLNTGSKYKKRFFFVHDKQLRDLFDTYKKVELLSKTGFKTEADQIRNTSTGTNIKIEAKKVKAK